MRTRWLEIRCREMSGDLEAVEKESHAMKEKGVIKRLKTERRDFALMLVYAQVCYIFPAGEKQEIHEYEASGSSLGRCLNCQLTASTHRSVNITIDGTFGSAIF